MKRRQNYNYSYNAYVGSRASGTESFADDFETSR